MRGHGSGSKVMNVNRTTPKKNQLAWMEPQWSFRPRAKAELSSILDIKMWSRVLALVILITVAIAHYLRKVYPALDFNWAGALAISIAVLAAQLVLFGCLLWMVPPRITINQKGICRQYGQSVRWRFAKDIRYVAVDAADPSHPVLYVEAAGKKRWDIGIPSEVNLADLRGRLREILPGPLIGEKSGCGN